MTRIHLTRPPRNDDELYQLVQSLWGFTVPRHKVCAEHQAPFDAFSTAFFGREPQVLVKGSRGLSGKSVMMSLLALTKAVVWGCDVNVLGGSLAQSNNVIESMSRAWRYQDAPSYMILSDNKTEIKLTNGAKIRPLTASQKTVRGPHPAFLALDEIDEMDESIYEAALGQPMPQKNWLGVEIPANTIAVSTHQYADSTMTKAMAKFREEGLPIYEFCYKDTSNPIDGWLSQEAIENKRRTVSRETWRVEYELGEPSIGNRAIDSEAVEFMFDAPAPEPLKLTRDHQEYLILQPEVIRDYVIAADWARDVDWTVITVWDATETPIRLAYYVRMQRRPYPLMVGYFNALQKRYHAEGIHDATGLGGVVADYLEDRVRNFLMTGAQRDNMLSEYVSAVERKWVRASRIDSIYTAHKHVSTDDMFSRSKEFHLPDEVCSSALAWKMVANRFPIVSPFAPPKVNNNWMTHAVEDNVKSQYDRIDGQVVKQEDNVFSLS
jgi:hypothetical protein